MLQGVRATARARGRSNDSDARAANLEARHEHGGKKKHRVLKTSQECEHKLSQETLAAKPCG
eukprot:2171145-Pyramimonas_sp.AAC.1